MAEIIAEPTALSKVIPLKFKINDVDVPKTTQLSTNKQFNTTDTDAWFTFELDGLASTSGTYNLTLINLDDKSIFHHADVIFAALPFHYKLNSSEDVTLNEIRHAGRWLGQLVVTMANGDTTSRQFGFNISGHILDGQDAQVILLSDYQALINTINLAKDDLTQYNVDYAALLVDIAAAENARVTAYNQLLADQQANIEAFDVALETGIVAANLAQKLQDFETTNNSRLLSAEQQLEQTTAGLAAQKKQQYSLKLSTVSDTSISSLTQRKNWQPMLLAVKESNIPNRPADNADQSPRPIGWLYYNVDTASPSGYKLLYASGKPDNIVQTFDWNSTIAFEQKTPEYFSFFITRPGDIIVLYRGEKETRAEHGRKNPIVYPYNDLANPVVVDLSSKAVKPTSWLMSCGAEYMYTSTKNYFMFGEYTRPIHTVTNIWKVDPPFTSPDNWNIVKSEPTSGSNTEGFEHFHMINYDPICGAIYASNGDDEASTKIWESRDNGTTWTVVASGIQNARVCNLIFTKDYIYWASDEPTAHVLNRVRRVADPVNGMRYGNFANIEKLADLPPQQASYGTLLLHNPPGLLMMDRFDDYIEGRKLQVPFWSFDTNSLHIIKEVSPHPQAIYDGLVFSGWGFRPNAYQKYQGLNDKRIIMGFDHTHPNYSNLMDVLDNNPGFYQPYIEKLHNLALEVEGSSQVSTFYADDLQFKQNELDRQTTFAELVDSEMIAQNVATKLTEKEATYAPRLLSVEQQLEQAVIVADAAAQKADAMASGSPKGVYATLALLQAAYPTGTTGAYLVTADGKWYYWSGSAWTAGGTYQSAGIADKSVTRNKTDFYKAGGINKFDKTAVSPILVNENTGAITNSAVNSTSDFIAVSAGDIVRSGGGGQKSISWFTPEKVWIGGRYPLPVEGVTIAQDGFIRHSIPNANIATCMTTVNAVIPGVYEPFKVLDETLLIKNSNLHPDFIITPEDVQGLGDEITDTLESARGEYITSESIKDIKRFNILDKDNLKAGVLISVTTGAEVIDATQYTSEYIDVRNKVGKHIISNVGSLKIAQYGKDMNFIKGGTGGVTTNRQIIDANTYFIRYSIGISIYNDQVYHERDYNGQYMAIWLGEDTEYTSDSTVNGGEGFELYDERGRVIVTRQPKVLKNHILSSNANLVIYNAHNDLNANRRSVPRIFVDHILGLSDDKGVTFSNGKDYLELPPSVIAGNSSQVIKTDKFKSEKYLLKNPKFNVRTVKSSIGASVVPRVLFIGDSITAGVPQMFDGIGLDTPYWGQVKRLFEMDKVDNGDVGYDIKILGGDTIPFNYNGVTRTLRGGKVAIGGYGLTNFMHHGTLIQPSAESWALLGLDVSTGQSYTGTQEQKELIRMTPQHAYPNVGEGQCIPFYDENATGATTFSVLRYLQRYRTMDDNGVRLTWGDPNIGSYIGSQEELDAWDVCTPTHIVLQHGRNDELYPNAFKDSLDQFISVVQSELPGCKIGICIPPNNGGTIFPQRYPNVLGANKIGLSSPYFVGTSYDLAKIILDNHATKEAQGIYLIPNYFVQPTAYSIPLKKSDVMCSLETVYEQAIDEPMVSHPSGEAHKAWAYQVYCWLKYTMI